MAGTNREEEEQKRISFIIQKGQKIEKEIDGLLKKVNKETNKNLLIMKSNH